MIRLEAGGWLVPKAHVAAHVLEGSGSAQEMCVDSHSRDRLFSQAFLMISDLETHHSIEEVLLMKDVCTELSLIFVLSASSSQS